MYLKLSQIPKELIELFNQEDSKKVDLDKEELTEIIRKINFNTDNPLNFNFQIIYKEELETKMEYERNPVDYNHLFPFRYGLTFYIPPIGIKLRFRNYRFDITNPTGSMNRASFDMELDYKLLWNQDFGDFVGYHEIGHVIDEKGYDEDVNTIRSAYRFQSVKGCNYTYLPK